MNFDDQLSPSFKVRDLTITKHSLASPNIPTDSVTAQNLTYLADVLEQLTYYMDFEILSGFRTRELQQKLAAEGEPVSSGLSFHEVGRAVDIFPRNMDLADAFGMIIATPGLKERFAEIAYKPSQNSLHLAVNVPGDTRTPKVLGLNPAGVYATLSLADQQPYIDRYNEILAENERSYEFIPSVSSNGGKILAAAAVIAAGVGAFLLF